ncbi:MAG: hypothetical protein R2741_08880 [Methanolobus sp.]
MREEAKKPETKVVLPLIAIIAIIVLFSSQSFAEVVHEIRNEIGEHEILSPLDDVITGDSKPVSSPNTHSSGSSSNSGAGSNTASVSSSPQTYKEPEQTDLFSLLKKYTEYYNSGINEVPDVVKKVAGNDLILLEISMNDNTDLNVAVRTEDGLVTEFRKLSSGEDVDPTVTLTSNENTIRAILKSSDPLDYFVTALNQETVNVECKGFVKKTALAALKALS